MKKLFTHKSLLLFFVLSITVNGISQTTIAKWTFDVVTTINTGTTPTFSAGSNVADVGSQTSGSAFTGMHVSASTTWSNPTGNGSAKSVSSNNWAVNDYYQFQISTSGYSGITITFDHNGSSTGPANFKVQYSINGTTFNDFTSNAYTIPSGITWSATTPQASTTFTFDLSSIAAINNVSAVYFRLVNTSTTSISGGTVGTTSTSRIDNFTVIGTATSSPLHFRSKASGRWNDVNTWESSSDGTTFTAATTTPDFNSNTITIRSPHVDTITANLTIDQTTINSQALVVVDPGVVVTINDGVGTDLTIADIAGLGLRSTATGTASIGPSAGTISGSIAVERYISNKRAWRLLGIPYGSSLVTIRDTWMEGLSLFLNGFIAPGYGTQITTFNGDSRASNFDGQKPASSIRIYAANNFNSDLAHTPNTSDNIAANQAYFLFVRGDRSVDRTTSGAPTSATILRTFGSPNTGNVTKGVAGTNFSLIPNPYPSAIDFDAIKSIPANSSINTFYVWDASLGTVGQYRTVQITGAAAPYTYTSTPAGGSANANNNWRFIESGTAFMVPGSRTVDFTEVTKTASIPPTSMLRTIAGTETELAINFKIINADNTSSLTDGVRLVFDNAYAAGIDDNDAKKISGFENNFGIVNGNEVLAIDKRPMPNQADIIALKLFNTIPGNYQFEVQPNNFSSGLTPYIFDSYLNTYTAVDVNNITTINFSITSAPASAAANRFSMVFKKPGININTNPSIVVYPNPVENGIIKLQMNNIPSGIYTISLVNNSGQIIYKKQLIHITGNRVETINTNKTKGVYMVEVIKPDFTRQSNKIIIN